ncbi:MAG: hypothetical protein MJE68_11930, partial [Proteobacteria bacterium]|nr:hypothetical protein [Pseudomonadota bacterium]
IKNKEKKSTLIITGNDMIIITTKILNNIIFYYKNSGFSLGGVLAHMLTAQLWQLPQISSNQLISNLICITFAEPFVHSVLLERVAESFPDFPKNVHALRMEKDSIPFILGKLDAIVCSEAVCLPIILSHYNVA